MNASNDSGLVPFRIVSRRMDVAGPRDVTPACVPGQGTSEPPLSIGMTTKVNDARRCEGHILPVTSAILCGGSAASLVALR